MEHKPAFDVTEMPYESNPFKLLSLATKALRVMAAEFFKLAGLTMLILFVTSIPAVIGSSSISSTKIASPSAIGLIVLSVFLFTIPATYLSFAFVKMALAASRGLSLPWRATMPKTYQDAWNLFWTLGISGIFILVGFLVFILPGFLLSLWYSQVQYVVVDEGLVGMPALKRSKQLVHGRMMDAVGLSGMSQIPGLFKNTQAIGNVLSLVYSVISLPIGAIRYIQLTQLSPEDRVKIPTNKWNYALILVLVLTLAAIINALILLHAYYVLGK